MKYKIGDRLLQITNNIFVRSGIIISIEKENYIINWTDKGGHVSNLSPTRAYTNIFIENTDLFDLINESNINDIIDKYIEMEDYETCTYLRNMNIVWFNT